MPAGKGWPGMRDPGYIRWDRQLAESHAHSRKAEVSVSLTDFLPPTRCHTFPMGGGIHFPVDSLLFCRDNVVAGIKGACPAPLIAPIWQLLIGGGVTGIHPCQTTQQLVLRSHGGQIG